MLDHEANELSFPGLRRVIPVVRCRIFRKNRPATKGRQASRRLQLFPHQDIGSERPMEKNGGNKIEQVLAEPKTLLRSSKRQSNQTKLISNRVAFRTLGRAWACNDRHPDVYPSERPDSMPPIPNQATRLSCASDGDQAPTQSSLKKPCHLSNHWNKESRRDHADFSSSLASRYQITASDYLQLCEETG